MDIEKNSLVGLYGNRKKTILLLLAGMERFEGDIVLDSISMKGDIDEYLSLIAVMTKESVVDTTLSVNDFLDFFGAISNAINEDYEERKIKLLEKFGLLNHINTSVNNLSDTNRKKVKLLSLFLKDHSLILLDTFLESFQNSERNKVISFLREYVKDERIVLIGSDDLKLLESFSDEIYYFN
jgi:putative ABC transport system permease protein